MQGRIWCGIALGVVSTLGGWGCSAAPKRSEAPLQFQNWKSAGGASAKAETAKPTGDDTFPVTPPEVVEATPRPSIWNYRPGSLLFHRKPAASPSIPTGSTETGALSRYFPGLSGKTKGDGLRLTLKNRHPFGSPAPAGGSVADNGNRLAANPSGTAPLLAVGLKVETHPQTPSSSLPDAQALANGDRTPDTEPAETPVRLAPTTDARLTSHETVTAPTTMAPVSEVDPLSLDLPAAPVGDTEPAPLDSSSHPAAMEVVAPTRMTRVDASGESSPVEAAPARKTPAEADPSSVEPAPIDPASEAIPEAPARMIPAGDSTEMIPPAVEPVAAAEPVKSVEHRPSRTVQPRVSRVEPMILPPAEFPPTYHAQSMSRVLKEEPSIDVDSPMSPTTATSTKPHRPLFPRLARLMSPKEDKDREVKRASGFSPSSALGKPGEVAEWWEAR